MRITFIVRDAGVLGGATKATLDSAAALADRGHDVTVAACVRSKQAPTFAPDPRITVVNLWDLRKPAKGGEQLSPLDRWRAKRPSVLDEREANNLGASSALLDRRVARYLRRVDTDVLIGTHLSVNLYLARYGRADVVKIAQEHSSFGRHKDPLKEWIKADFPRLDAVITATEADAADYREALPGFKGLIADVPNPIPPVEADRAGAPVVMAAGRLAPGKGFATLIRGFSRTVDRFPEWRLRIYGRGKEDKALAQLIEDTRSEGRTELMGPVVPLDAEWSDASIAVVPSHHESFSLIMGEAMSAGVPVVASAAPHGPLEVIEDGHNGLLVPPKDVGALTEALERLMGDPGLRAKLADGGRETARRFAPETVAERYETLFERLLAARR
ncbi:glycosyltransferase [Glycomyces arizonensis]|uniref:glycosyltransferase n=1 Tax=Glycomyces arizonensis TaxID=256035 RepID=UPI0003F73F9A|nr:glycosyltransferase [Glycomyces arizonensis]